MCDHDRLKLENNSMNCLMKQNLSLALDGSVVVINLTFTFEAVYAHLWNFWQRIIIFEKSKAEWNI